MSLKLQIQEDMKNAMRAKEALRLSTIRLLMAEIKKTEIDKQITLDDSGIMSAINKMIKQRRDSIQQFQSANRNELAEKEQQEIDILQTYLPKQMSETEVEAAVKAAIASIDAKGPQDMGKVMGILKGQLAGRADMTAVSAKVKSLLQ